MKLSTINKIVQAIMDEGEERAKAQAEWRKRHGEVYRVEDFTRSKYQIIANEATIYLKTAMICETQGIDKAMEYLQGTHSEDEYTEYLTGVTDPKETL